MESERSTVAANADEERRAHRRRRWALRCNRLVDQIDALADELREHDYDTSAEALERASQSIGCVEFNLTDGPTR